jgi:hypothetical protein
MVFPNFPKSMKTPILLIAAILIAGGIVGWRDHQHLLAVRATHDAIVAEAAKRGIFANHSSSVGPIRVTKRQREDTEVAARILSADYITFAKEKEVLRKNHAEPDESFQQREADLNNRIKSLNPAQWKILIAEVCASKDLNNGTRQAFLYNSIPTFAKTHPQAALDFLGESPVVFEDRLREHLISTALVSWSRNDPLAAIEWYRKHGRDSPDLITAGTKRQMITGAAFENPRIAFEYISTLNVEDPSAAVSDIVGTAITPEKWMATLVALREHLSSITDEKSRQTTTTVSMVMLAHRASQEGFSTASQWAESANLSREELNGFIMGLGTQADTKETGQWVEWIGRIAPDGKTNNSIRNMLNNWTRNDYQAAGEWLGTLPAGPTRNISVHGYIDVVFKYDPETAAQWAMTLPVGEAREATLRTIYTNWPKNDAASKAAAAAFANEHGIK